LVILKKISSPTLTSFQTLKSPTYLWFCNDKVLLAEPAQPPRCIGRHAAKFSFHFQMRSDVEEVLKDEDVQYYTMYEPVQFKSQVVAGTNYEIEVTTPTVIVCVGGGGGNSICPSTLLLVLLLMETLLVT
jgi:hypothetical protein